MGRCGDIREEFRGAIPRQFICLLGGHVFILFEETDHLTILIIIRDNGVGRAAAKIQKENTKRTSHATQILKDRIKVLNIKGDIDISVRTNDLYDDDRSTGTEVIISMPPIKTDIVGRL